MCDSATVSWMFRVRADVRTLVYPGSGWASFELLDSCVVHFPLQRETELEKKRALRAGTLGTHNYQYGLKVISHCLQVPFCIKALAWALRQFTGRMESPGSSQNKNFSKTAKSHTTRYICESTLIKRHQTG